MAVGDVLISVLVPNAKTPPINNIFVTLLLIGVIVAIIEGFRGGDKKLAIQLLLLLIGAQVLGFILVNMAVRQFPLLRTAYVLPAAIFPSLLFCEGSLIWVFTGLALYFSRNSKLKLSLSYTAISIFWLLQVGFPPSAQRVLFYSYQWMMIAALPLMLCYNGQKGRGLKWLFYIFYPAHIFLLCWIGSWLSF